MILVLVEGADTLTVHYETFVVLLGLGVNQFDWLVPNPESLGARVDSGTHAEALVFCLLKEDAIEQK